MFGTAVVFTISIQIFTQSQFLLASDNWLEGWKHLYMELIWLF